MHNEILALLKQEFQPLYVELIDESHMHSRATAQNPETHFKLILVADIFKGLSSVKRQQLIYKYLTPFFQKGLHALTQHIYTAEEWALRPKVQDSPKCAGHSKLS